MIIEIKDMPQNVSIKSLHIDFIENTTSVEVKTNNQTLVGPVNGEIYSGQNISIPKDRAPLETPPEMEQSF